MTDSFLAVCENFKFQSKVCKLMGSEFYSDLLNRLSDILAQDKSSAIGATFTNWPNSPKHDAVALRFAAALNYLVITEADADLQAVFPPHSSLTGSIGEQALKRAIHHHQDFIIDYLKSPPQTNEVGRSIVLLGGFLDIAKRFGPELDIFEIGASAGLNMSFDQYFYQTDSWQWGEQSSTIHFKPNWKGNAPPLGPLKIHSRKACDVSPINAIKQKNRLLSYVWPDQTERAQRVSRAIDYTAQTKPLIDAAEASQWLNQQAKQASDLRPRVFYHSIVWQYFSKQQQKDFSATMKSMGEEVSGSSPLIWMRLEPSDTKQHAELRITVWPMGAEYHLADCGFHGEWVEWHGE